MDAQYLKVAAEGHSQHPSSIRATARRLTGQYYIGVVRENSFKWSYDRTMSSLASTAALYRTLGGHNG